MTGRRDLPLEHFTHEGFDELILKPFSKTALLQKLNEISNLTTKTKVIETIYSNKKNEDSYSLETIKMFLGEDKRAINEVLYSFKMDTIENRNHLKYAISNFDISKLNQIAHKMLPMFRQLQVLNAIPILENFEVLKTGEKTLEELKDESTEVLQKIEALIQEITTNLNHNS